MKMVLPWKKNCAPGLLVILLGMILLLSCAGGSFLTYDGKPARLDNRHALNTTEGQPAVWKTQDVALYYTSSSNGERLQIDGTVERLNTIKHYPVISSFRISIHFLDPEGLILASRLLWSAGIGADSDYVRWEFNQTFGQPEGTSAMAFSYRGKFSEEGGESGSKVDWEVWFRP